MRLEEGSDLLLGLTFEVSGDHSPLNLMDSSRVSQALGVHPDYSLSWSERKLQRQIEGGKEV